MWNDNYQYDVKWRILNHSVKRDNGCIEYRGDSNLKHRYGLISITVDGKRKSVPAHRALWMAIHNQFDLPGNIIIRHKCDNTRCVNEEHLLGGSHKDNSNDKFERGRNAKKYRLHTRQCDVSDDVVRAIRNESDAIKLSHIASKYNISIGYISKIRNGKAKTLITA